MQIGLRLDAAIPLPGDPGGDHSVYQRHCGPAIADDLWRCWGGITTETCSPAKYGGPY